MAILLINWPFFMEINSSDRLTILIEYSSMLIEVEVEIMISIHSLSNKLTIL